MYRLNCSHRRSRLCFTGGSLTTMHTVSVNLYAFGELAPEVQRKVVERERFINIEDAYWYEPIIRDWTEQLEKLGFQNTRILFSGFGSQGDGACFEARINMAAYLAAYHLQATYPLLAKYPEYVEAYLKHTGWFFHESRTMIVPDFNRQPVVATGSWSC